MNREAKEKHPPAVDESQTFKYRCTSCGERGVARLRHYEKVKCACCLIFWALRPRRNEPMKLYVHPSCKQNPA